jgi:hypothetical protein
MAVSAGNNYALSSQISSSAPVLQNIVKDRVAALELLPAATNHTALSVAALSASAVPAATIDHAVITAAPTAEQPMRPRARAWAG